MSKALLRRVNHERGEVAYRAGGETAEEHRALVVSSHLELEIELELAQMSSHMAHALPGGKHRATRAKAALSM